MINYECSTNFSYLVKLGPVFNTHELTNTLDPKIILEFEFALFIQVVEIEFAGLQVLKEKITVRCPLKEPA
jgi:hypothetical protein